VLAEVICSESSQIAAAACDPDAAGRADGAAAPDAAGGWVTDWPRAGKVPQPAASKTVASAYAALFCPRNFTMPHAPGALAGGR